MMVYSHRSCVFWLIVVINVFQQIQCLNLHWISPRQGSIAGGTTVLVVGSGFATDQYTGQNFVFFGDIPCIVKGYTVSSTRFECVTQPYPGSFEGVSSQWFQARIISKGKQYQSSSWVTRFRYNWGYTPQVRDVLPPSGPVNSLIEIGGYRFSSDIANRYTHIFLGDQICDFWDEYGDVQAVYGGRWYYNYYIKCLVKQQIPGAWNASAFMTSYSGMTWNHSQAMKLGFDGKLSMFELYPDIHGVQPNAGGVLGGTLITITGTGFGIQQSDIKLEVDVNGMPCEVTEHSSTEIKCWTRRPSNNETTSVPEGYRYLGSRGSSLRHFTGSSLSSINDLYTKIPSFPQNPDKVALLPSFSSSTAHSGSQYGARYMAFFTPVQSGKHTFFIKADDWAILYLTEGKNITNLTEIARVNSHASWDGYTSDYSSARSDPMYLEKGKQYLLVGDMVEVYGADFLRVGVLMHETEFLHNETTQSVRERQLIEFDSHGHYDIQNVYIKLNTTELIDGESPPVEFEIKWGSRSKTMTSQELITDEDTIAKAVLYLLKGVCDFYPKTGVYYFNQAVYDFEADTITTSDTTSAEYVKEASYCGYQSVLVSNQVIVLDPEEETGFRSSDYPTLCMAYKIPPEVNANVIIHIENIGWQSLSLTSHVSEEEEGTGDLGHWSDAVSADDIIADNMWHHGCTDIHSLIVTSTDSDSLEFTVTGFGFESVEDNREFFIDAVSFTSAPITIQNHLAPSKPNGISVHQLINNTLREWKENDTILSINVTLEVIPTSCDHEIPLILLTTSTANDSSIIMYGSERLQNASESIQGTYILGVGGSWTDPIDYYSEPEYIRNALNALPTVSGDVDAWYRTEALPQDKLGKYCPGRKLVVRFDRVPGDNPLLFMNASNLTGHGLEVEVKEIETGGLFLYPIPGHMLQSVEKTPQVHIRINNQLAACGGGLPPSQYSATYTNPCGFSYNISLTPTVTSILPITATTGDVITINGQGFSAVPSNNFVLFGDVECDVTQATDNNIQCTLGKGQAGNKHLWVHVLSSSVAETNDITLEYILTLESIEPMLSGTGGGVEITITGDGFVSSASHSSETSSFGYSFSGYKSVKNIDGCSSWKNKVLIGDKECEINSFSSTIIKCTVPPGLSAGSFDMTASVYCADDGSTVSYDSATFPTQFTYDDALQPTIISINPLTGSGRGGEMVSIIGTGFTNAADDVTVHIGGAPCDVSTVSDTNIDCVTSPHSHDSVDVMVTVALKGNAVGSVQYQYQLEVTDISKCTGSLFGGQLIVIDGNGFGTNKEGIDVKTGAYSCSIQSITNTEISCFSGSTASTHQITNNVQNPNYGLGYSWDKPDINITVGDSVEWKWTGSAFTPLKRIVEVDSDLANEYNGYGFASDKAIRGTFTHTFSSPGVHYYIMEGYGHIGFRGKITVQPYSDQLYPLTISFDSVEPTFASVICGQSLTSPDSPIYSYLINETPTVFYTPSEGQLITVGSDISISVQGVISLSEYNVLTIGGKPCTSSAHTSTSSTSPSLELPVGIYTYTDSVTITCTIPDIYPGDYRLMLHVSGRGWGYSNPLDTTVAVRASIHSNYVTVNGSLAGGTILSIPVTGIDQYIIGQTNVYIGNTQCLVQDINTTGSYPLMSDITCITNKPGSDGYSTLVSDTALCYWSLQYELYNSLNEKYGVENANHFSSTGKLMSVPASVVGSVKPAEPGISGSFYREQSAYFSSSYLNVEVFERYTELTSFSFEMWFKGTLSSNGKYAILASSYQNDDEYAKGFIVAINPCNHIEFWLGDGQKPQYNESNYCYVNTSTCEYLCSDGQVVEISSSSLQYQMPTGVWSIVSTENEFSSESWNHLIFSFEVLDSTSSDKLSGTQRLYLNTKLSKADNVSYHHTNESDITFGGSDIIHTKTDLPDGSQVYPFTGYIDEISLFEYILSPEDISEHYIYGTTGQQQIVIDTEYVDGVGEGTVPDLEIPPYETTFDNLALKIKLDDVNDNTYSIAQREAIHVKWTGLHGLYQVQSSSYDDCLKEDAVKMWSPVQDDGSLIVWLESGSTYYFIDPVGDNCLNGVKFQISVGSITVVDWTIGDHADINIMEGDGIVFKWNDAIPHNLIEMTSPESVTEQCMFVGEQATDIGKVKKEWKSHPEVIGEVVVLDLSAGLHYFVCSVGSHCMLGMRMTVNVSSQNTSETKIDKDPDEHLVPWYVPSVQYETLNIFEGESIVFAWNAFHSLHQVSESVYESCDTTVSPLYEWARSSVDNSVKISDLSAGTYYYICSVSGHCDAGMKLKVEVNERQPNILHNSVTAGCNAKDSLCSFSYNGMATPTLLNIEPLTFQSGNSIHLNLTNYDLASMKSIGDSVDDLITILIGTHPCSTVTLVGIEGDDSTLTCTTSSAQEAGSYEVHVYVETLGFTGYNSQSLSLDSDYITVSVSATLTDVSPSTGSVIGGTLITLTGTGFSHMMGRMNVNIGEYPCNIVKSTMTNIECRTTAPSLSALSTPLAVSVDVNGKSTGGLSFTYSVDQTPTVTGISEIDGLEGGTELQIMGSGFGTAELDVTVEFLSSGETFYHGDSAPSSVLCNVLTVSSTVITCTAPYRSAGVYSVSVHVKGIGLSMGPSAPPVIYSLAVDQVNPTQCSHGGGLLINLTGSGFPLDDEENVSISVCKSTCKVVEIFSEKLLSCLLQASGVSDPSVDTSCAVVVSYNSFIATSVQNITYKSSLTPTVTLISPDSGGTAGGTYVTVTGQGLLPVGVDGASVQENELIVTFDGAVCEWFDQAQFPPPNNAVIMCRTSDHRTTVFAEINVFIDGKGNALIQDGLLYRYVDRWSSVYTWGGLPPPLEGESVYIKEGQTVYLDTDTPVLNLILIEGELIFEDEQDIHLQAKYIFINNGKLQIGTEDNPFTHSATVKLHGRVTDPEIPIYGAKVIGIRQGELDIHGKERTVTWTRLSSTAMKNMTTLELQESVDWVAGDNIVIAPTTKEGNETETHVIDSVSDDGHTVYLTRPLAYTHHGITEVFENGASIDIRAEVGLLSHNVVIEGSLDDDGEFDGKGADQYGVQIMIHRTGPHPTPIRIENTEVRYAGQAFRLGRYAIHFHLSGNMSGSYVRNCAIHHSNNRALTAHGVHNLLVEGNVAYNIKGHAFFVEDGIETNNRYLRNFGVYIRSSSSLLNTDQIPAVFWITNPNNVFIGNAAVASRAYGFWYDLDNSPSGPSYTTSVCPNKEVFGEFSDNTAHSCNEFGLRIWETYFPYADGCNSKIHSSASLYNFTTYANDIHGVEFSVIGNVKIIGFKVADNRDNGIEIQETNGEWEQATIEDTLIISHTSVNNGLPGTGGIKTPNTRGLKVSNVTFANFNLPTTSCLRACSHCKILQGGFQVSLEKLHFIGNSSLYKAYFQWEHEVLFRDLDGSLSGRIGGGWVLPNSDLHPPQYCNKSVPEFSVNKAVPGTVCTTDVYFVRMAWNNAKPLVTLQSVSVNVSNKFGTSIVQWRHYRLTHMDGYMLTMPSQYSYLFTWQLPNKYLIDVMSYSAGLYSLRPNDYVVVSHDFVQSPDHVNIGGNRESTETLVQYSDPNLSWYKDNVTDSVYYLISGLNATTEMLDRLWTYSYEPCPVEGCPQPPDPNDQPLEENQRRWSSIDSWPNKVLPAEGEDVLINSTWRMLLDVSPPPLGTVTIAGELEFENVRSYNFTAKTILIHGPNAHLIVGSEGSPFIHSAVITLTGNRGDQPISLPGNIRLGNKALGIFGNVTMFGKPNSHSWTTLDRSCNWNDSVIYLKDSPDWSVGDRIVISSSSYEASEAEIRTITDYDKTSSRITLDEPLKYNHEVYQLISDNELESNNYNGTWWWTGNKDDITVSPEVGLLSHNIVIQGGDDDIEPLEEYHYGCRILVGEYTTSTLYTYTGTVNIDSVEIRHCGQGGYFSPIDPRYSLVFKDIENSESVVSRSSVHHGYNTGIGIHASSGVKLVDNVVYRTTGSSIICGGSDNFVDGNLALMTSTVQPNAPSDNHAVDFPATFDINRNNIVRNNAAAGSNRISYRYTGEECNGNRLPVTGEMAQFWNNSAHSGLIAMVILGLPSDCSSVSGMTAHHHWDYAVFSSSPNSVSVSHMKLAIGKVGFNLNIFGPNPVAHLIGRKSIHITDSLIVGFIPKVNCASSKPSFAVPGVSLNLNTISVGIMMSSFNKKRSKMDGTGMWHLMKGYPTVDGKAEASGITFAHFIPPSDCSYSSALISNNPLSPDAVHPLEISGVTKINVTQESLIHFYDPNPDWIVQEDCVDMDCDGPKHALIRDADGSFSGSSPPALGSIVARAELRFDNYSSRIPLTWLDFEDSVSTPQAVVDFRGIYRGNPFSLSADKSCEWVNEWNAYRCRGVDHLMLVIESMDGDSETRRVSPVALVGSGPEAEYTDLLNGPMDHGWCTYYTCLKRLSTFFSVVSTGIDYHIWMTGSLPGSLRLHLLNSNADQAIRVNIWYKDPRRKDTYRNGIFIESSNTKFLENGAVTQLDGDYLPSFNTFSGANYFDKQTKILSILVKGPDIIEIKTPPVMQISLTVAVSVDEFFIQNLISNLAYVLQIDVSRIRVVNIIAEDSLVDNNGRRKRSVMSNNTISLEFGDPPGNTTDPPIQESSEADWLSGKGENDDVDIKNDTNSGNVSSGNPFNEEAPETIEDFAAQYNELVNSFEEEIQEYKDALSKVNEVNRLGASIIDLVQAGGLEEFSINAISAVLATAPTMPDPPIVPPDYVNVTTLDTINITDIDDLTSQYNSTSTYTVPTQLIIEREPSLDSGHLVYVIVSVRDNNGDLVTSLGFHNPWKCTAMLISESFSKLEGEIEVTFEDGIATFTRLRVDRPSSNLRLAFVTNPGSLKVNSSVMFNVHEPIDDANRKVIVLILIGNTSILDSGDNSMMINDIRKSLSHTLDIDYSRIRNIDYEIMSESHLQLTFDLLDNATTDPPDVPSLSDALENLQDLVLTTNLTIVINGSSFFVLNGSLDVSPPISQFGDPTLIIISVAAVCSCIILSMLAMAFVAYWIDYRKAKKKNKVASTPTNDFDFRVFNGDTELDELRNLRIPRASITQSSHPTGIVHHPSSAEPWIDTTRTSLTTLNDDRSQETDSLASLEMPRIPRPFSRLPSSVQFNQSKTFASF